MGSVAYLLFNTFLWLAIAAIFLRILREIGLTPWRQPWRWLKGSRTVYWLDEQGRLLQTSPDKTLLAGESFLRIIERPFCKTRAIIFGKNSARWTIRQVRDNPMVVGDYELLLEDRGRQSIQTVLRVVNTAPSFPVLLDRIAELEKELASVKIQYDLVRDNACSWSSGVFAALEVMEADRQRYRSKAAEHVRKCLDKIKNDWYPMGKSGRSLSWKDKVGAWRKCFPPPKD